MPHYHPLQRIFFHRQLAQARFDDVAKRDQTDQLAILNNRHMAKTSLSHRCNTLSAVSERVHVTSLEVIVVIDLFRQATCPVRRKFAYDVPLRQYPVSSVARR